MNNCKEKFMVKLLLGREVNLSNTDVVIHKCAELAYKDMLSAGRYYLYKKDIEKISEKKKKEKHEKMIERCGIMINLLEENNYMFSRNLIQKTCLVFGQKEIIGQGKNYVTRYGLAQKFVNMMFKYLYLFSDYTKKEIDFSLCDCPLDSIILQNASISKRGLVWSKISEEDYCICQQDIEKALKSERLDDELQELGNLAFDFIVW